MKDKHKKLLQKVLNEKVTLDELSGHFIELVRDTIIPFVKKLEDLYYSKIDLTLEEQSHIKELKDVVLRFLHFESQILQHLHNNKLSAYLDQEINDVKKITRDVQDLNINGLEKDFEELLIVLEGIHVKLHFILKIKKEEENK